MSEKQVRYKIYVKQQQKYNQGKSFFSFFSLIIVPSPLTSPLKTGV